MRKTAAIAGQGVRTCLGSKKKTTAPGLAAAVENVQVCKEVVAMAASDSKEGESTSTCSVPSVMESPKQANTLDVQAQVAAESCSSEANQEAAVRHAGSQEGSAAGCEEAMESAKTACCVAEEPLREKPNPAAAAMVQVGAIHLCDHGGEEAAGNGAGKPETVGSAGPNHSQIIILQGSISNMFPETVSVPSTSANTDGNINGVSMPSAVSVPGTSVSGASVQCDKAAGSTNMATGSTNMATGSTNMAAPLINKTVYDAAVRENIADKGSVTRGAGNHPVNSESVGAQGRRGVWDGKRLLRQNFSVVSESQASRRKNEVKIKWVKERGEFPGCRFVARNLIKESLGFTLADVFGLRLDEFWRKYEGKREAPEWEGGIPVSQPETKTVSIMFKTVCVSPEDVMVWLKRQCTVLSPLTSLYDEEGQWGLLLSGQPRVCFRCGPNRHFAAKCPVVKCALCVGTYPPDAWHNIVRDCPNLEEEIGQRMEIVEEGVPTSELVGSVREVVQLESSVPCSKVVGRAAEGQSRKRKEGKESGEEVLSQEGEWESLEEDIENDLEGEECTPKFQVKRRGKESGSARQKQNRI
ncbi:hypothetical protein XELAEV_18042176mg [Xenopus laevis]|uniref:CCHC-type domain-containing protein n=1 Tax=Xenopus laevis TaxID=8355 RepID=A0A974C3P5_XENLA|nr:hypothetical protein XELAEV_18042176mg [Xenopus laevis]